MPGRAPWMAALAALGTLGAAGCDTARQSPGTAESGAKPGPSAPPAAILIVVDALRADRLGLYGYRRATSPRIDRWGAQAAVFTQALAQAAWTVPSLATIMTSLPPSAHGAVRAPGRRRDRPSARLAASHRTLAEVLRDGGVDTALGSATAFTEPGHGLDQGFKERAHFRGGDADVVLAWARTWLASRRARPFFLYLHLMDVHGPYDENPFLWDPEYRGKIDGSTSTLAALRRHSLEVGPRDVAHLSARYDGGVTYLDERLGRFLESLPALGLADRTLVILTADHGEEFMEHGHFDHGLTLYDTAIRVPLVVRLPGAAARRVEFQVRLLDVMPTVLDYFGVAAPQDLFGASLLPAARGLAIPDLPALGESHERDSLAAASLRLPPWKYIRWFAQTRLGPAPGTRFLYDVARDPGERHDVLSLNQRRADALDRRLETLLSQARAARRPGDSRAIALPDSVAEGLRRMGYVE
ncbi:MAG: sulfatase [Elusimicrobia bacterium]|nr:sulfatase [Elusimicrobiota bacterium]